MPLKILERNENETVSTCPNCHTVFGTVMVEIQGLYDGALYYNCRECDTSWHRWPKGTWQREKCENWAQTIKEKQ